MVAEAQARGHSLLTPTHADCDLVTPQAVADAVLASQADIVINCAAISGLEACAEDALATHRINAAAPAAMALACRHSGARFVHLSTDYVLCGRKPGLRDEGAPCRPICLYGESKREGEIQVQEANAESLILRVSWLCGNPQKPGFPESMAARALAGQPLAAIADKYSLPTDVQELAYAALELAESGRRGLFHLCSTGEPVSWWYCAELAMQALVEAGALPHAPAIAEQRLAEVPFFREPRPRHTAMSNAKLRACGIRMSSTGETIAHAVQRWLAQNSMNFEEGTPQTGQRSAPSSVEKVSPQVGQTQ